MRTGSVPSIAAGLTVGALVSTMQELRTTFDLSTNTSFAVRTRRLSDPEETPLWYRTRSPGKRGPGRKQHSPSDQDGQAPTRRIEHTGCDRLGGVWQGLAGPEMKTKCESTSQQYKARVLSDRKLGFNGYLCNINQSSHLIWSCPCAASVSSIVRTGLQEALCYRFL